MIKLTSAMICTLLFAHSAFSDDFNPEDIPPQRAITLLKATNASNIYYLLTTNEASADVAGNDRYLLVFENGKVRLPRQKTGFVYFDGGSTDLQFENGERLVVPTQRMPVGYLGVAKVPMMMSPDRAPYLLASIEMNAGIFKSLGFAKYLAPELAVVERKARERNPYVPFVNPETVQLVELDLGQKLGYRERDQLISQINGIDPTRIKAHDRINQGAFYGGSDSILIVGTDPNITLPLLRAKLEGVGQLSPIDQKVLDSYLDQFAKAKPNLADVKSLHLSLGQLETSYRTLNYFAQYESAVLAVQNQVEDAFVGTTKNARAVRLHPFYKTGMAKIRAIARLGYEALDRIGHPAAQEILTHTAQEFDYAALDIVKGKASVGGQDYFDLWLEFMRTDLDFVDNLDDHETSLPASVRSTQNTGGIFQDFKVSGNLLGIRAIGLVPHIMDNRPMFLLGLLGFADHKQERKTAIIQFLIDADKRAAKIVAFLDRSERPSHPRDFSAKGVANIKDLLQSMAWTPYGLVGVDGFSVAEYQKSVLEVFTTLFDIAPVSLKTTGTMAALANASVHILNDVKNYYHAPHQVSDPAVETAAHALDNRLRLHFQRAVESLGQIADPRAVFACEFLLSPNAMEKLREHW